MNRPTVLRFRQISVTLGEGLYNPSFSTSHHFIRDEQIIYDRNAFFTVLLATFDVAVTFGKIRAKQEQRVDENSNCRSPLGRVISLLRSHNPLCVLGMFESALNFI